MCISKDVDITTSKTHSRPEPEGEAPTERINADKASASQIMKSAGVTKENQDLADHILVMGGRISKKEKETIKSIDNLELVLSDEQKKLRQEAKEGKLGIKFDGQKLRWDLLPYVEIEQLVDVLTYGAEKYADNNWQHVPNRRNRYFAAAMRHLTKWFMGEKIDPESGRNHLAHVLCCVVFLLWDDGQNNK